MNDLPIQELLLDRRLVLQVLDMIGVPTPRRLVTWNNDFPKLGASVIERFQKMGLNLMCPENKVVKATQIDSQTIQIQNSILRKPFVEKPVSGEDHNIYIYYDSESGDL